MKRILHFGGVLLALGMLLASCNMAPFDSTVSGNSTEQESSNINSITIGVNSIDNNSRTILPADWDEVSAGKLTYVLTGEKTSGTTENTTLAVFSYDQLKNKTATVNLEMVTWTLKLTGYIAKDPDENNKPQYEDKKSCLVAEDTFNLSTGTKAITFNLKPVTEDTEATGGINVSISWLTTQPKRIEFGIFPDSTTTADILKENAVTSLETGYKKIATGSNFTGDTEAASHTENWTATGFPVGMYKFAAVFYNAEIGGNVIGYYIDWLYVDGGNVSKATVNYGDKFNTIPENPSWLAVETAFIPQPGTSSTTPSTEYYAKFHWNDRSNNETGFELVINDGTEDYVVNPDTLDESPLHSDYLLDGETATSATNNNLSAGTTSVVLKLTTGKKYTAKVRAINDFTPPNTSPDAKFCKTLTRNGDGRNANFAPFVTTGTGETAKYEFGMFTVNYALNGGKVIPKEGGESTASNITNYIVGYNYSSEEQNLMTGSTLVYPHISNDDGKLLADWDDGSGNHLTVSPANNINPIDIKAHWSGVDLYVSVTFPSYANARQVKIASGQNEESTVTFNLVTQSSITVNANASLGDDTLFVLTDSKGTVVTKDIGGSGKEWIWSNDTTKPIKAGIYCLQITGTYKDTQGSGRDLKLCGNIYINVTN